jgi:UDP-N-acetylglucosamine acyltransferase
MRRRGYSRETMDALHHAFHLLLTAKLNTSQAVERIRAEIKNVPEIDEFVTFIESSQRGVVK